MEEKRNDYTHKYILLLLNKQKGPFLTKSGENKEKQAKIAGKIWANDRKKNLLRKLYIKSTFYAIIMNKYGCDGLLRFLQRWWLNLIVDDLVEICRAMF